MSSLSKTLEGYEDLTVDDCNDVANECSGEVSPAINDYLLKVATGEITDGMQIQTRFAAIIRGLILNGT